jgi:hypothetical protein
MLGPRVIELPLRLTAFFSSPNEMLGAFGEQSAGDVGLRIGLKPNDAVIDSELRREVLKNEPELIDIVKAATHPETSAGLQHTDTFPNPPVIKRQKIIF